jgi:hypothetical protein
MWGGQLICCLPVDVSRHAEIGDFDDSAGSFGRQQTIPGGNIAVNEMIFFQVTTSFSHVQGAFQQVSHCQRRWAFLGNQRNCFIFFFHFQTKFLKK